MAKTMTAKEVVAALRAFGLTYPKAHLKSPWPTHRDLAVNDKTFAYLSKSGPPWGVSCKLPHTQGMALMLPGVTPTGYGLGKSGWVSAALDNRNPLPLGVLQAWIDESYRAQAPKSLVKALDAATASAGKKAPTPKKTAAAKKAPGAKKRPAPATKAASARKPARAKQASTRR